MQCSLHTDALIKLHIEILSVEAGNVSDFIHSSTHSTNSAKT